MVDGRTGNLAMPKCNTSAKGGGGAHISAPEAEPEVGDLD